MVAVTEDRLVHRSRHIIALLAAGLLLWAARVEAQALPKIEGPVTMEQAVALALEHSRKVRASGADRQAMASMRREAVAGFLPQVSMNWYLVNQNMRPNLYSSAGETMARNLQSFGTNRAQDLNVTAMWPIFSGGRTYYGYKAASARAESATEMLRGTEVEVAMQARLDYIATVREQENARVTGELQRQTEERLRVTREEFEAGKVPQLYLFRDEAELANVIQMDTMARNRAELALVALKTTLGVDLGSPISVAEPLGYEPITVSVEQGIRQAVETHPDVQAAARQLEAAEAEVRAALGRYLPEVSATWMYDWQRMRNRDESFEKPEGYSAGLVMTIPLFDGFMRENAGVTARAKRDKARELEVQARQQVAKEVNQAGLMLVAADRNVEASGQGLDQAQEQFRIAQERFTSGRGIQLEVLDAQATLTRARFNVVAALADHHSALAMWFKATGRVR
ncbi:MAG: TolC family protein [candidate division NC10 bacterium]|nr:TolC family protein [candidate division NC10 bacterium]